MLPELKLSYYNHFIPHPEREIYLIYNSLNCSMIEVEWNIGVKISKLNSMEIHFLDDDVVDSLLQHGMIINSSANEFDSVFQLSQQHRDAIQDSSTLFLVISPTNTCNMSCPYCYQGEKSSNTKETKYLTKENLEFLKLYIADSINNSEKSIKKIIIEWFGGEPLIQANMIKEFSDYVINLASINNIEFEASIITNGFLLSDKNIEILQASKIRRLQITIDGNKEMHDSVRYLNSGKGSYDKILENISRLPHDVFFVTIRINGDKRVFEKLEGLFDDLEAKLIWPHKAHRITFDWCPKFFNFSGFNEEKSFYYTSYEYQKSKEEFAKFKVERYNTWANKNGKLLKKLIYALPKAASFYCGTVESPKSISIDDGGYVHKCYNTINDKSKRTQHISNFDPYGEGTDYYMKFDKTKQADCMTCKVLPICEENCNMRFVTNAESKICSSWKYFMDEKMINIYEQRFVK